MSEEIEVTVHFHCRGEIYNATAQFRANWFHISLSGRRLRTGGWDYALARTELGDDKFAITAEQFEEFKAGRSVQVDLGYNDPVTIEVGDYALTADDRTQRNLFES